MQHLAAGEVPAEADQRQAVPQIPSTRPTRTRPGRRDASPTRGRLRERGSGSRTRAPTRPSSCSSARARSRSHRRPPRDSTTRHLVEQRQAVPEHVAARRLHEQRPLADRERRRHADAAQPGHLLADVGAMRTAHLVVRHPALAVLGNVLPLVAADRARRRRLGRLRVLRAARPAEERRHRGYMLTLEKPPPSSGSPSGHSCSDRAAASRIACASSSRRVRSIPSASHSQTNQRPRRRQRPDPHVHVVAARPAAAARSQDRTRRRLVERRRTAGRRASSPSPRPQTECRSGARRAL